MSLLRFLFAFVLSIISTAFVHADSEFYNFVAKDIKSGDEISMSRYKGKVVLIANVASECGFTDSGYRELVDLQRTYDFGKFQVLAFPCNQFGEQEPKKNRYILDFAIQNYDVNFQMFAKVKTIGKNAHPLYKWLKKEASDLEPSWNFCKYLLNDRGQVVRYASAAINPLEMEKDIKALLAGEKLKGGKLYYEHFDEDEVDEEQHEEL